MDEGQLRRRVAEARVARIGTVDERRRVHLVPIVFVLDGDRLYSATDDGPRPAKRMRNLARDPRATVLVDAYDEDWSTVWWVRLRGRAVTDAQERAHARQPLWDKYPQFGDPRPAEAASPPMMAVDIEQWPGGPTATDHYPGRQQGRRSGGASTWSTPILDGPGCWSAGCAWGR